MAKPLVEAVRGRRQPTPPIWIMRQAGRYLPEYRQVRAGVGSFLELCYSPKLATEVSLQPLRRFELDAAIVFSDILVVPDALGQKVTFETGEGPRLDPLTPPDVARLDATRALEHLSPVLETIERIAGVLAPSQALIGFCGAPWTVATYMLAGRGSSDQAAAKLFALTEPTAFAALLDTLVAVSVDYLVAQLRSGADLVQIFESWAANLDESQFDDWVVEPNRRIVAGVRAEVPGAAIIGFPRGAHGKLGDYAQRTGVDMVGLDYAVPPQFADSVVPGGIGVQGNLDPVRLVAGGRQMAERAREIVAALNSRPHVFNLGHGILPTTPVEHVGELVRLVKGGG